jgi:peptide subunit release factor 1 (eRF1)
MTVKYNYKCSSCEATYLEMRAAEEPQFFTACQACGAGTYEETSVEVISETVERVAGPAPIEELVVEEITE